MNAVPTFNSCLPIEMGTCSLLIGERILFEDNWLWVFHWHNTTSGRNICSTWKTKVRCKRLITFFLLKQSSCWPEWKFCLPVNQMIIDLVHFRSEKKKSSIKKLTQKQGVRNTQGQSPLMEIRRRVWWPRKKIAISKNDKLTQLSILLHYNNRYKKTLVERISSVLEMLILRCQGNIPGKVPSGRKW